MTQPILPVVADGPGALTPRVDAEAGLFETPAPRMARAGLAWTLVRTDFKVRYHGTLSGFAWALLKPAGMFLVLMGVFSFLFTDPAYKLQLIIGLFLWDFFAESTKVGMASLQAKAFLFKKMRVPLGVLILASIANPLITLGVFSVVIVAFLTAAGQPPSPSGIALFAVYCAALTFLVLGFSLATSVLLLRYRDLNQVWDVIIQAGFFLAPIIYPLGIVTGDVPLLLLSVAADADYRILARRAHIARRAERRSASLSGARGRGRACGGRARIASVGTACRGVRLRRADERPRSK